MTNRLKITPMILILFLLYCFTYIALSTGFYLFSISQGKEGLDVLIFDGSDDGVLYAEQAKRVSHKLTPEFPQIHGVILGYVLIFFNSQSIYLLKLFNLLGNVFLLITALLTLRKIVDFKKEFAYGASILIILLLYYPSLLINTGISIYRDAWICLYFLLSIYFFSKIQDSQSKHQKIFNIIMLLASVSLLGSYRGYALLSFLIGSIFFQFFISRQKRRLSFKKSIAAILIGFSIAYTFMRGYTIPYLGLSFQTVLDYRHSAYNIGGSQMGISLDQPNIILFYINYFHSFIGNVLGPLPWQINGGATLLIFIAESLLFILVLLFLFRKRKQFTKVELLLILQSTVWFMLISISNDNLGTAARLRMVGWIPLFIVFSKYYGEYLTRRRVKKTPAENK